MNSKGELCRNRTASEFNLIYLIKFNFLIPAHRLGHIICIKFLINQSINLYHLCCDLLLTFLLRKNFFYRSITVSLPSNLPRISAKFDQYEFPGRRSWMFQLWRCFPSGP